MDNRLLTQVIDIAARLGAADSEAVISRGTDLEVEVAKGEVETLAVSESIGLGVRLFTSDRRMGFAYTTNLADGPQGVVEAAWQNALCNDPDEHNVLPEDAEESEDDWSELDFGSIGVPDKVEFARTLERKTLEADSRITHVQQASYGDCTYEFAIVNSRGMNRRFRNSYCSASVVAAAHQAGSDAEMGWEFDFARTFEGLRLDWIAATCAKDLVRRLGGKPCATRSMPMVLDNYVANQFLQVLGSAFMASNVLKGKSLFAGRVGEGIASEHVTLVDQNDLELGMNRGPFDGEGISAQKTVLVSTGTLKGYLHNTYTASRMGEETTANAGRGGFRSLPDVGATNFYMEPGDLSQEGLFGRAGDGLFVTDAMGVHTADPISGDFSFGASGLLIENGILTSPVRGVTIAGNIKDLLQSVAALGNDLRFFGAHGSPSLLVSEIMVSGE